MNCETTTTLLSEYYDGGLTADERRALESHLQSCSACTTEFKAFTESMKALHETKSLETTSVFTASVKAAAERTLDRKENLLSGTGGVTVLTPKADAPATAAPARPSPAPAWVPWALAATLVAAFGLGMAVSGGGRKAEVEEAVRAALAAQPPPETRTVEVVRPVDERKVLEKNGLVMDGGEWVPLRYKQGFAAGKICIGGEMMEKEAAVKALVGEPPPKPPDPVPPAVAKVPTVEEILERHHYTKVNDVPVPKAWVEKWGEGWIQVGVNEWRRAADFKEDFVREHGLVEYRGKLMTREQAELIQAQQLVKAPEGATAANEVTRALDGLQIGPPVNFRGITVYPLIPAAPAEAAVVTLHDALGSGKLEVADTGGLFAVQVRNGHESDVLIVAGAVLAGGRCARVAAEDRLIRAGKTETVAVLCVEPSAWRPAGDKFARESGHYLAPPSLRRSLAWQLGQGAVWGMLARKLDKTRPSLVDLYRRHAESIVEIRGELARLLDREAGAAGVAVAIGDSLEFVELFPGPALLRVYFDRILSGAALEALEREADPGSRPGKAPHPNSVKGVKQFLEAAFSWTYEAREDGFGIRKDSAWIGRATGTGGAPAHLLLHAVGAPAWERRPSGLGVPKEKMARALAEYETRLRSRTAGPSRKAADIQDLGSIGGPEVTVALLRHLGEPDVTVRSAVIQELGASRDPKATEPLVQLLAKSRQDAPLFAETVRALGRLGDESAVDPLLKQIDAGDPAVSRTVIQGLPELLLQVRNRDILKNATQRLVVIYESVDSVQRGEGIGVDPVAKNLRPAEAQVMAETVRTALTQVTEQEFGTAAGCRKWWNDRDTREKYLRERTGK